MTSKRTQSIQALADLVGLLRDDVKAASDQIGTSNDQAARRAYVRAVFAFIEGMSYGMKQWAYEEAPDEFTAGEQLLLRELQYELKDNGKPKERAAHLLTLPNVRFAFAALARAKKVSDPFDVSGQGWQDMQSAIKVRHALTHPKTAAAMTVSDSDFGVVQDVFNFYLDAVTALLAAMPTVVIKPPPTDPLT